MSNVVNLADYRPKTQIKITGKLDSKKVCEILNMGQLLYYASSLTSGQRTVCIDGENIVLDKDDIEAEIRKRD